MDLFENHAQNKSKVDTCFVQLQQMGTVSKSSMWKFYRNVSKAWLALDSEFVECRRRNRLTLKYTELEQKFQECVTVFEQWAVMVALLY